MPRERKRAIRRGRPAKREPAPPPAAEPSAPAVARGIWSGSLSFGLVTIPVELYSATRPSRTALRMLAPDGTPLVRRYACSAEGRLLQDDEIVRGYEAEPGRFLIVTDEELAELAPRRSRDIELLRFVPRGAIDPAYFVRSYFLMPGAEQSKAYRLLAQAMEAGERAAVASFVMRGKSAAVAIFAERGLLRAVALRFGDELRSPDTIPVPPEAEPARVKAMTRAVERLAQPALDERELVEEDRPDLLERARAKLARGEGVVRAEEAGARGEAQAGDAGAGEAAVRGELIDLFQLIKQRIGESPKRRPPVKRAAVKKRSRARASAR